MQLSEIETENRQELDRILKKCINDWWMPYWDKDESFKKMLLECWCTEYGFEDWCFSMWYDQLFSVDVWLLEFLQWKPKEDFIKRVTYRGEYRLESNHCRIDREYHCMVMSMRSVEEKISYFLQNVNLDGNMDLSSI